MQYHIVVRVMWSVSTVWSSEQEQMAANQSTTLDQTVDGETAGMTGSVMLAQLLCC